MERFRIYYPDRSVVEGSNEADWRAAPSTGVQVVVAFPKSQKTRWWYPDHNGHPITVNDRDLWTGTDSFDPFGWGPKDGSLVSDADYFLIWDRACGDI